MTTHIANPKDGKRVRMENGAILPEEGKRVVRNSFWIRREKDGDVDLTLIVATQAATKSDSGVDLSRSDTLAASKSNKAYSGTKN